MAQKDAFLIARVPLDFKKLVIKKATSLGLTASEYMRRILEKVIN